MRKTCREETGFRTKELKDVKYLTQGNINSIIETSKIMKEKKQSKMNQTKKSDKIYNFVTDNREISMKNFLLELLKEERCAINDKELMVNKALKDSENKLEKDFKYFVEFMDKEKKFHKENELRLLHAYDSNRELLTRKKKYTLENKQICDEIDRTIKSIFSLKANAGFVHIVLGGIINNIIFN